MVQPIHEMCEQVSMTNKPHLSGLRIKVKVIRKPSHGSACRFGGRGVIKPEGASHGDAFALPFRVGRPPPVASVPTQAPPITAEV